MDLFIKNILTGVRQWVNGKLENMSYVISSHIHNLNERVDETNGKIDAADERIDVITSGVNVTDESDVYVYGVGGYDGTNPESAVTLQDYLADSDTVISNVLIDHENRIQDLSDSGCGIEVIDTTISLDQETHQIVITNVDNKLDEEIALIRGYIEIEMTNTFFEGLFNVTSENGIIKQSLFIIVDNVPILVYRTYENDDFSSWDIKGFEGSQGPEGPEGPQGPAGPNGADGQDGADGADGVGLEFEWSGTTLGVKREDEPDFTYQDLTAPLINDNGTGLTTTWSSSKIDSTKQDVLNTGSHITISPTNEIDTTGVVASQYIASIWRGTQAEYDALSSYDNNTLYVITQ